MDDLLATPVEEETTTGPGFEDIPEWATEIGPITSGAAAYAKNLPSTVSNTYTVFITNEIGPAETDFCRHSVIASSLYEAGLAAVKQCRLTAYGSTMIAEVFAHSGNEYRFSYQLVTHES